jgi:hypothetical protein
MPATERKAGGRLSEAGPAPEAQSGAGVKAIAGRGSRSLGPKCFATEAVSVTAAAHAAAWCRRRRRPPPPPALTKPPPTLELPVTPGMLLMPP